MLTIDALVMDKKVGEILKPEADAIPFRSSVAAGIGIQKTSERGPGFTLTCTTHVDPTLIDVTRQSITAKIGTLVELVDRYSGLTITYNSAGHGNLKFAVTQARVVQSRNLAAWQGYRLGVLQVFEPAGQIVSQWTMYAVPVA